MGSLSIPITGKEHIKFPGDIIIAVIFYKANAENRVEPVHLTDGYNLHKHSIDVSVDDYCKDDLNMFRLKCIYLLALNHKWTEGMTDANETTKMEVANFEKQIINFVKESKNLDIDMSYFLCYHS